ncbi:MAG TPA: hypothetical protein V6D04_05600, partial [Candidatus Obscuribacterales bacterium]
MRRIYWVAGGLGSISLLAQFSMQAQAEVPPIPNTAPNTAVDALQPQTKSPSLGAATDLAKGHLAKAQVEASPTQVEFAVVQAIAPLAPSTVTQLPTATTDA